MSVAGILSSLGSLQLGAPSTAKQGQHLKQDLQPGDLNAARSAFAAIQQAFAEAAKSSVAPRTPNHAVRTDSRDSISQVLRQLTAGANSAHSAASQPLSSRKQDPTPGTATANNDLRHRSWNLGGAGASRAGGTAASQTSLLNEIGQALASGDLSSAQQASAQQASAQLAYFGTRTQPPIFQVNRVRA